MWDRKTPKKQSDDPTRIHMQRKYVGQAKDKTSIEMATAKQ